MANRDREKSAARRILLVEDDAPVRERQTVPVRIENIFRKLHANNRPEAAYETSRRGLIRL